MPNEKNNPQIRGGQGNLRKFCSIFIFALRQQIHQNPIGHKKKYKYLFISLSFNDYNDVVTFIRF
ncbi:MAG: hypothetical protein ACI8RD_001555 [Bacillariaceae sp.]|jgi:hypothetical protein